MDRPFEPTYQTKAEKESCKTAVVTGECLPSRAPQRWKKLISVLGLSSVALYGEDSTPSSTKSAAAVYLSPTIWVQIAKLPLKVGLQLHYFFSFFFLVTLDGIQSLT